MPLHSVMIKNPARHFLARLALLAGGVLLLGPARAAAVPGAEPPPVKPFIHPAVTLPPEITAFIAGKEKQAETLATQGGFPLSPGFRQFFLTARQGKLEAARQAYQAAVQNAAGPAADPGINSPVAQAACDVELAVEAFGQAGAEAVLALAREMTNELTPGSLCFGGTDYGRGLPAMLCPEPGVPFFVLSQNPLADGRYLDLLQAEYGRQLWLPASNDVRQCYLAYTADAEERKQKHQLLTGENVTEENGRPVVRGEVAMMKVNALIARMIFDRNTNRDCFVVESYPLDWMYPRLQPAGLLLKLDRGPLQELPAALLAQDEAFWSRQVAAELGDWLHPDTSVTNVCAFVLKKTGADPAGNAAIRAWLSKFRVASADLYAWRLSAQCPAEGRPTSPGSRQQLQAAADLAFRQAFALCPTRSETAYGYISLLAQANRLDDALLVAQTSLACQAPDDQESVSQFQRLVDEVKAYQKQVAARMAAGTKKLAEMEAAYAAHPDDFRGALELINARAMMGQTNQAFTLLEELAAQPDLTASQLEGVAHFLGQYDRLDTLESVLTRITVARPDSPENWYDLAALKAVRGDRAAAVAGLKRALELNAVRQATNSTTPDLASVAAHDRRLAAIRDDPEIQRRLAAAKP